MQQKDHMIDHQTLEFIQKSLLDDARKNNTRACPFCLQNIDVDQLSEHVSHCLELWNDLRMKRSAEKNSDHKRKLFSCDENDHDEMNLNSMKKKKIFQNQFQILPNDMIRQILSFQENKFLIGVCMRVCKQWLEIVRAIPLTFEFWNSNTPCSTIQNILENQSVLCLTKLSLVLSANIFDFKLLSKNKNLDNLATLTLECGWKNLFTPEDIASIVENPYMSNLCELTLLRFSFAGNHILTTVSKNIHLTNLKSLTVDCCNVTVDGLSSLNNSLSIRNLTHLQLDENGFGNEGAKVLAECSSLNNLQYLSLMGTKMKDEGLVSIYNSPYFRSVTELHLNENEFTDISIEVFYDSLCLTNIQTLNLSDSLTNTDPQKTVSIISSSQNMKNLKNLNLSFVYISDNGVRSIANSSIMSNLISLDVCYCQIGNDGMNAIARSAFMKNLQALYLSGNKIQEQGLYSLATSPYLGNLTLLDISNNQIGSAGAKAITSGFSRLKTLNISECEIGNDGIEAISNSATLTNLEILRLDDSPNITNWKVFACSRNFPKLRRLCLLNNSIEISEILSILKHFNLNVLCIDCRTKPMPKEAKEILQYFYPSVK